MDLFVVTFQRCLIYYQYLLLSGLYPLNITGPKLGITYKLQFTMPSCLNSFLCAFLVDRYVGLMLLVNADSYFSIVYFIVHSHV